MKSLILIYLVHLLGYANSYKILVCYPLYVKSMNMLGEAAVRHLLNDGHEVTFITTHPMDIPQDKNFRQIDISAVNIFKNEEFSIRYILENKIMETDKSQLQEVLVENARLMFQNENVTNLLSNSDEHFDAVIVDLLELEVYAGLAVLYDCPMIWIYSMTPHWTALRLITDSLNPSYDTDFRTDYIPPFSFGQRIAELWARIKWYVHRKLVIDPAQRDIYKQTFEPLLIKRDRKLPEYEDIVYNSSFIFGYGNNAVLFRTNTPSNYKDVGGFHIEDPVKPLPKDLQLLMDSAKDGVIYFSMGSFWKSKDLPVELTKGLLDMFGELKQTVIWKFEYNLDELPKNVHIFKWAPQQSILAHPNCKLFITHGGQLSTTEIFHFGVPIIGIPVLYDQFINIKKASMNGYAIKVDFNYDLPRNLKEAIKTIMSDNRYKEKIRELSSIYHDRTTKPGAELVHWIRHVVRTGGASHLRSPAVNVPLYQRLYLDLGLLIVSLLFTFILCINIIRKKHNKNVMKLKAQ